MGVGCATPAPRSAIQGSRRQLEHSRVRGSTWAGRAVGSCSWLVTQAGAKLGVRDGWSTRRRRTAQRSSLRRRMVSPCRCRCRCCCVAVLRCRARLCCAMAGETGGQKGRRLGRSGLACKLHQLFRRIGFGAGIGGAAHAPDAAPDATFSSSSSCCSCKEPCDNDARAAAVESSRQRRCCSRTATVHSAMDSCGAKVGAAQAIMDSSRTEPRAPKPLLSRLRTCILVPLTAPHRLYMISAHRLVIMCLPCFTSSGICMVRLELTRPEVSLVGRAATQPTGRSRGSRWWDSRYSTDTQHAGTGCLLCHLGGLIQLLDTLEGGYFDCCSPHTGGCVCVLNAYSLLH